MEKEKHTKPTRKLAKETEGYAAYSEFLGLVFQMFAIIGLGTALGMFLDTNLLSENSEPWFTIVFSILSATAAMYLMIRKSGKKGE